MKLDNFSTAVEGRPVYKANLSKGQGWGLGILLAIGIGTLVYFKYVRNPTLRIYSVDPSTDKARVGLNNTKDSIAIKAGQSLPFSSNFRHYNIAVEAIKDAGSTLTNALKFTLKDSQGNILSEETKNY